MLGWGQAAQNRLLIGLILLFVAGSFLLARAASCAWCTAMRRRHAAYVLVALAIPALLSGYAWSNPTRFLAAFAGTERPALHMTGGPTFIFGSYPDDATLRELKQQGVTAIVSLQSPSVIVELSGIDEERKSAAAGWGCTSSRRRCCPG